MIDFKMPALGADMDKGTVVSWHVQPGSTIQRGDIILDVETDKGTIAVDVWESGRIAEILVQPGQTVTVGTPLARIDAAQKALTPEAPPPAPSPPPLAQSRPLPPVGPHPTLTLPYALVQKREIKIPPRPKGRRISPLARSLARDLGVDLTLIPPPPDGRPILRHDVETFVSQRTSPETPAPLPSPPPTAGTPSARLRAAIAEVMARSKREVPHYYLESEIYLSPMMEWLDTLNAGRSIKDRILPVAPLLKAVARAAVKSKVMNGFYTGGIFHPQADVHLGVVLSLREGGIVNPAIRNAERLSVDEIMQQLMDLIQRARHGKLKSSEVGNQTITVTSLGETGADKVMGIIYPPQVALVGFGCIRWRPWAEHKMIGAAHTVNATLSADHRVSDGLSGAAFLREISRLLQNPASL